MEASVARDPDRLVGENVRALRTRRGLTQQDLADRLAELGWRIDAPAIAKIEAGRRSLRVSQVYLLSQAFEAWPADIIKDHSEEAVDAQISENMHREIEILRGAFSKALELREHSYGAAESIGIELELLPLETMAADVLAEVQRGWDAARPVEGFGAYGEGGAEEVEFIPMSELDPETAPVKEADHQERERLER